MFALASPVLFYFFGILKENEKGDLKMIKRVRLDYKPIAKRISEDGNICRDHGETKRRSGMVRIPAFIRYKNP